MSIFENHTNLVKYENGNYLFKYGDKYGWIVTNRTESTYDMYPIEWLNDNDYKKVLGIFPSFPAVLTYLSEVDVMRFIVRLKEEITYGVKNVQ